MLGLPVFQNFQSISCNVLKNSAIGDDRKIAEWKNILVIISRLDLPLKSTERSELDISPQFLEDFTLRRTSIEYVKSILGTPRTENNSIAVFYKSGCEIKFGYVAAQQNVFGQVNSITIMRHPDRSTSIVDFDGWWNPHCPPPESHALVRHCEKAIRTNAVLGSQFDQFLNNASTFCDFYLVKGVNSFVFPVCELKYISDRVASVRYHVRLYLDENDCRIGSDAYRSDVDIHLDEHHSLCDDDSPKLAGFLSNLKAHLINGVSKANSHVI